MINPSWFIDITNQFGRFCWRNMYRKKLKSKINRVVVTETILHYEGSITIDKNLMDQAGLREFEFVQIGIILNGHCLET